MRTLEGTTALLTGASQRLGAATARELAAAGAALVIHHHRSRQAAEALVAELTAAGARAWTLTADLADERQVAGLLPAAVELAGPIDLLVNNASIFPASHLLRFAWEELAENLRLHAWAPLVLSRALAAAGRPAAIVNLLDSRYNDYDREHAAYHLSKRMLYDLTRLLALELAPAIRVNAVAPGLILPPPGEGPEYLQRRRSGNPLGAVGTPADIASAVRFLAESDFVTGQVLFVDGGRHLRGAVY